MSPEHTNEENAIKNKQFDFKSLAPKTDVDLTAYEEAFQFALSNDEIKNVAVTGSYGAGKSSVMETFKATETGQAYTYLHISLAHFEKTNSSDDESKTEEQLEHQLEGKIINQLIHKIPIEKIPDTRVALRKTPDEENVLKWTLGILAGMSVTLYLVFYQSMLEVVTKDYFISKICRVLTKPEWLFLAVVIEGILLFCLIKYLVSAQMKNRFFKKICIKDSEIELFEEGDKEKNKTFSYFDRYLDEIKYLLINADVDVFVFEDIDRYNINLIFEKLREINSIVNVSSKKPIRFFYLIRDDLFVQKDRTKFFDFIIPVLPIVSGHNAFHVYLEYMGLDGKLKREFLKQISLFIDDMRLLNNIYNEYQIYQHKMDKISVDKSAEKIFSLVTYKNLFPEDFIRLQRREGYIVDLFEEKKKQVEERLNKIEQELALIQSDLKVTIDGESIKELQSKKDTLVDERIGLKGVNFQEYVKKYKFKGLEQGVLLSGDAAKKDYNRKMSTSLYAGLVRNLLSGGYIDENYGGLIAMFHDSDISQNDMKFIRAVLDNQCLDYKYKLDDVKIVNDYLEDRNIESEAVINKNLFCYYLDDKNKEFKKEEEECRLKRKEIITNTICNYQKYDFVKLLLEDENIAYSMWVDRLSAILEEIYGEAKKNNFEWEKVELIFATALMGDELLDLTCLQEEVEEYILYTVCKDASVFEKVLAHDKKVGADRQDAVFRFGENLDFLGWKLPQFQFDLVNSKAFANEIYMSHAYVLNIYMIKQILNLWYGVNVKGKVVRLYDKIVSVNEQYKENENIPLYQYIEDNMNVFVDMLINSRIEVTDSSKNVAHMILFADEERKKKLVSYMKTSIESVAAINELSLINNLIKRERLAYKAKNILEYYDLYTDTKEEYEEEEKEFTFDNMLVDYINQMPIKKFHLTKAEEDEYYEKNKKRMTDLFVNICKQETINDEKYRMAVKMLGFSWSDTAPVDMPENKMDILIEEDIIQMSKEMLSSMRKRYPNHIKKFIIANIDLYVKEIIDANNFNFEECIMLLETDIKDEYKQKLLSYTTKSVSVKNDKYSENLILYILENNYDRTDFEYIIRQNYQNKELQAHVNRLAEGRIAEILREYYVLSKNLCLHLLKPETDCIDLSQKKKFLVDNMKQFSMDEVHNIIQQLNMTEFLPLFENKNPLIEVNSLNTKILYALQKQGYVGNYGEDEKEKGYYRVYSKKKWNK